MITRLDGVTCGICFESLFCARDDLDELYPVAAGDCGHVFHEHCLRLSFDSDTKRHIEHLREYRGESLSPSEIEDAPARCPSCRAECFVDDDTGELDLHRLYFNIEGSGGGGSSQAGSSPLRPKGDGVAFSLARRAKGLGEEVKDMNEDGETNEEDMAALMRRAEGLQKDLVSQRAVEGMKTYVGGLTVAINNLRATFETHPAIPTLRARAVAAEDATAEIRRENKRLIEVHMPQEIQRQTQLEQLKCKREVSKAKKETEAVKRELEKEAVLRRTARKEAEEKFKAEEKKAADAVRLANKAKDELKALNVTLNERTRSLRTYQAKAESKKALKAQVEELEEENTRLRAQLETASAQRQARPPRGRSPSLELEDDDMVGSHHGDADSVSSFGDDPAPGFKRLKAVRRQSTQYDDSLEILDPSFADISPPSHSGPSRPARAHPTARTLATTIFDDDPVRPPKRKQQSKYFAQSPSSKVQAVDCGSDDDPEPGFIIDSLKRGRSNANPFSSNRAETDRKKTLAGGRAAPQPGQTRAREAITIGSSSPEPAPQPLRSANINGARGNYGAKEKGKVTTGGTGKAGLAKQPSMVEFLGIADKNGRPVKGLAYGATVKRKA